MNQAEYAAACAVWKAYTAGDFTDLFANMAPDYRHLSFWVLQVIRGKEEAQAYYLSKKAAWEKSKDVTTGHIVRITKAPDRVRPHGVYRNGQPYAEPKECMNRRDEGRYAVYLRQHMREETVEVLAIVTAKDSRIEELLITDPKFYEFEETEQQPN